MKRSITAAVRATETTLRRNENVNSDAEVSVPYLLDKKSKSCDYFNYSGVDICHSYLWSEQKLPS